MDYLVIILMSVLYTFGICFIVQFKREKCADFKEGINCCIPNEKENKILFGIVLFMLILCGVFLKFIYNTDLIDIVRLMMIVSILCPAAYTDWNSHIIANKLILVGFGSRLALFMVELCLNMNFALHFGLYALITAAVVFVIGFLSSLIFKGSIGMGDVKLIVVMALFQGASGIICSVFVSLIVSFIYCIAALVTKKKQKNDIIPFAPSLLLGTYISICLFGV